MHVLPPRLSHLQYELHSCHYWWGKLFCSLSLSVGSTNTHCWSTWPEMLPLDSYHHVNVNTVNIMLNWKGMYSLNKFIATLGCTMHSRIPRASQDGPQNLLVNLGHFVWREHNPGGDWPTSISVQERQWREGRPWREGVRSKVCSAIHNWKQWCNYHWGK